MKCVLNALHPYKIKRDLVQMFLPRSSTIRLFVSIAVRTGCTTASISKKNSKNEVIHMSCEYGFTRTNYFRVTDLDTMDFLMSGVIAEDLEVLLQDSSICIRCAGEIQGMDDELFEETGNDLKDF